MKIWKRLRPEHIILNAILPDKEAVLRFTADAFARNGVVKNAFSLYDRMFKREKAMSTGIGYGIGFPHTASPEADEAGIILTRLASPIDFQALDALPVDVIFAMVVPENASTLHLQILAGISRLSGNPRFMLAVRRAESSEELLDLIRSIEEDPS